MVDTKYIYPRLRASAKILLLIFKDIFPIRPPYWRTVPKTSPYWWKAYRRGKAAGPSWPLRGIVGQHVVVQSLAGGQTRPPQTHARAKTLEAIHFCVMIKSNGPRPHVYAMIDPRAS